MKMPKSRNKYCPKCKKHTEHKVTQNKGKTPFSIHPLSPHNAKLRGKWRGRGGFGNKGKWGSKPAISKWKMAGKKTSKKTDLRFECSVCKKSHTQDMGFRSRKVEFV